RARFLEFDQPALLEVPDGVVDAWLGDVGPLGDRRGGQATVIEHGEIGARLVLAQVEALVDPRELPTEILGSHAPSYRDDPIEVCDSPAMVIDRCCTASRPRLSHDRRPTVDSARRRCYPKSPVRSDFRAMAMNVTPPSK